LASSCPIERFRRWLTGGIRRGTLASHLCWRFPYVEVFVSSELEIRATKAQVAGTAGLASNAVLWLWPAAQVANVASERDLPCGTRQVVVSDGDKLRDKVVHADDSSVTVESEFRPRRAEVKGRKMRYELSVEPGSGTAIAKLEVAFMDRDAPTGIADIRRWRRHTEQCLRRLAQLAAPAEDEAEQS